MGYQALLFCPDEKTARTVTQVLSELDFAVVPCTEPFAAVKKLMGEHFDAVVVDCDNEQNATLLFKSARNAPNNHSSLAVAVVEGQAGVAKAFRIGANLVLTKPVNVEQAKGTLRVARGLLRKSEAARPATGAATAAMKPAAQEPAPPKVTSPRTIPATSPASPTARVSPWVATVAASIPAQKPAPAAAFGASASSEITDTDTDVFGATHKEVPSPSMVAPEVKKAASAVASLSPTAEHSPSSGRVGTGAASAPAPARELKPGVAAGDKPSTVISEPESPVEKVAAAENSSSLGETTAAPSSFTLGGNVSSESGSGGSKKVLFAVAAVVLVAAVGYAVWIQWISSSGAATPFTHAPAQPATTAAKIPLAATNTAPITPPSGASTPVPSSAAAPEADTHAVASSEKAQPHTLKANPKDDSSTLPASPVAENKAPNVSGTARPIAIKNHPAQPEVGKSASSGEVTAPSLAGIASTGNSGSLPDLMSGGKAPAPVLQDLHVSQGVSRGLLVKEIQPVYPASARQMRIEGAVELLATISKNGDISTVKVLSGSPQLAHAAVDAVKQWKYKPYLLNGEPVEIQTQVTVKFQLPH